MESRLHKKYKEEITPALVKELKLSSVMAVPKLKKIVVNAGIGSFRDSNDAVESFKEDLAAVTGQQVYPRKARLSEAGFKVRKGDVVGLTVTLRGAKMWAFLDKLISIVFPRMRDFRGLSVGAFDSAGSYSIGIKEHTVFPEINPNKVKGIRSLQVVLVLDNATKETGKLLLDKLGMPFKKD